ncbi:hypothetical protein ADUPG1_003353, partial [Aduncisulcus paluster]
LENLKKILVWSIVAQSIGFFFGFFKMVVLCSESCCCAGLFVLVSIPASILILVLYILQILWFFKITAGNEDLFEPLLNNINIFKYSWFLGLWGCIGAGLVILSIIFTCCCDLEGESSGGVMVFSRV